MKKALILIGVLIVLIMLVGALLPSKSYVERKIVINAPVELIFDQVSDLQKNFNWSPWIEYDPEMTVEWGDLTKGLGASYSWSGNSDVGSGTLTISELRENEYIENAVDFGEMGLGKGSWTFKAQEVDDLSSDKPKFQTEVTWGMESNLDWPIGRYFGLFMDGLIGPDFEKGLAKLKSVSESLPVVPKIEVSEVDMPEMTVISLTDSVSISEIGVRMGEMYGQLVAFLEANKLEMTSAPVCFYHKWDTEAGYTVMEAALPVASGTKAKVRDGIIIHTIDAGLAAKAVHIGPYNDLDRVHYAIDEWISKNGRAVAGSPMEVYLSDPQSEPDSSKWITEIYYPIQ